jgi:26S proteasome regulatory subunit N6
MAVSPHQTIAERIAEAQKVVKKDPETAESTYKDVLQRDPGTNDAALRNFETALIGLGELYRTQNRVDDLADLIRQSRSALSQFARAKTSKLGILISL